MVHYSCIQDFRDLTFVEMVVDQKVKSSRVTKIERYLIESFVEEHSVVKLIVDKYMGRNKCFSRL
jgi:hypothetical protein